MSLRRVTYILSALVLFTSTRTPAASVSTAFSYQGRLTSGAAPAQGLYDLQFTLYDAVTNGSAVGGPLLMPGVGVSNGLFQVTLDLGSVFDGSARWLEIAARTNGAAVFTDLWPRQPLSAAPYATYAPSAGLALGVSTGAVTSAMLADGAVTSSKLGAAVVKKTHIDDGGTAAYDELMDMGRGVSSAAPLAFAELSLMTTNTAPPTLTFRLEGGPFGTVVGFTGCEAMSQTYEYIIEVVVAHPSFEPESQVGRPGCLYFARNGRTTVFGGLITACALSTYRAEGALYTFRLEPALSFLALSSNYRIYQNKTVPQILSELYTQTTSNTPSLSLSGTHTIRSMTVQFAEKDLSFFSRLLEEEGIFYYYRAMESPPLVLADTLSSYQPPTYEGLRYYGNFATNPAPREECLRGFYRSTRESTRVATLKGYDFEKPRSLLLGSLSNEAGRGEEFGFDARTTDHPELDRRARVRAERALVERYTSSGAGNAPDLRPGYTFSIDDRADAGVAGNYLVTAVRHAAFRRLTNGVASVYYGNQFEVIPALTQYRAALKTPKPTASASTAVVTGPPGEEIHVDKYGRVKVQFHWDRYGTNDNYSSGWLRVASQWAGDNWGSLFLPRVGQEVLVQFIGGDPDQPVIAGSFYNSEHMPPYDLPTQATRSGIRTRSSKGGLPENGNEIRFEDKTGSEELYIKAEKDHLLEVNHDLVTSAGHDATFWAGNDSSWGIGQDFRLSVDRNMTLTVSSNLVITTGRGVGINSTNSPGYALTVGGPVLANSLEGNLSAAYLTGTILDARLSANAALLSGAQTFTGAKTFSNGGNSFTGNGAGLTGVNADLLEGQHGSFYQNANNLAAGTVPDARLSANIAKLSSQQSFSAANSFLGPVGIGGAAGSDALNVLGNTRLNNNNLWLRDGADLNHGLGWYGAGKEFAGVNLDGPVLFGCDGGGLGTACGGQNLALRWRSDGTVSLDPNNLNNGTLTRGLTFGGGSGEGIGSKRTAGGNGFGMDFYTSNQVRMVLTQSGNVGIGRTNPAVALEVAGAIRSTGAIRTGTETGAAAPGYPAGSDGLVLRRARSTSQSTGLVVARTDKLTLERDGSVAGLRLVYPASPGVQTVNCIGLSTNGTQVVYRNVLNNPGTSGVLALFTDAQKIVHYDISFGDTYSSAAGHITHVVLDRFDTFGDSDNYMVGTITSTYNQ